MATKDEWLELFDRAVLAEHALLQSYLILRSTRRYTPEYERVWHDLFVIEAAQWLLCNP